MSFSEKLIILSSFSIFGCSIVEKKFSLERKLSYIETMCGKEDGLPGNESKVTILIDTQIESLREAKGELGIERYNRLSQTLLGYSAEWENLHQARAIACRAQAACLYEEPKGCNSQRGEYAELQKESYAFLLRLRETNIPRKYNNLEGINVLNEANITENIKASEEANISEDIKAPEEASTSEDIKAPEEASTSEGVNITEIVNNQA